jgi:hypothetical protein
VVRHRVRLRRGRDKTNIRSHFFLFPFLLQSLASLFSSVSFPFPVLFSLSLPLSLSSLSPSLSLSLASFSLSYDQISRDVEDRRVGSELDNEECLENPTRERDRRDNLTHAGHHLELEKISGRVFVRLERKKKKREGFTSLVSSHTLLSVSSEGLKPPNMFRMSATTTAAS